MKLRLFKTLWGHAGSLPEAVRQAREAGFDGIEGPAPLDREERAAFFREMQGVPWIAELCTCTGPGSYVPEPRRTVEDHLVSLERGVERILEGNPLFITTMAGWDGWGINDAIRFHEEVLERQERFGVTIAVETHRTRCTYSPWLTVEILRRLPELRMTCDFSHWCVVSERLVLDESPELLETMAACAWHIHARVGYAQGPQVPDPRAPEHQDDLLAHERWWQRLWEGMRGRGMERVTMTPEAGPDGYQQREPFSGRPVAGLEDVNRWMAGRLRQRFGAWSGLTVPR